MIVTTHRRYRNITCCCLPQRYGRSIVNNLYISAPNNISSSKWRLLPVRPFFGDLFRGYTSRIFRNLRMRRIAGQHVKFLRADRFVAIFASNLL